jgi:hypothetical protein
VLFPLHIVKAQEPAPTLPSPPTPAEVINAVNTLRLTNGLPALMAHSVLMQVAQEEANGIASGQGGHWRPDSVTLGQWLIMLGYPLSGDLSMDGYRSENWGAASTAEEAVNMWLGDDIHTNTMLSPNRSDIGVGIAVSDQIYIVLETALQTNSGQMQSDAYVILTSIPMTQAAYASAATLAAENGSLSQYSMPLALNTALPNGEIYHEVQYGQTLWSIAIAYHTTIKQIQQWNNLYDTTVVVGQKLLVAKNGAQPQMLATATGTTAAVTRIPTLTPAAAFSSTPEVQPIFEYSEEDRKNNAYGVGAIGMAAIFLGVLFTVITRKKPV